MWNGASSSSAAAALSDRSVRKWGLGARLRGFCRDQDGALIIFGLMLFILMLMIGGLAVDLMRHENTRTRLQNTLDRSVLAAASLNQTRPPADVVRDYMLKAGLTEQLDSVQVTGNLS
ncbi:MAG: Tad domain-containing protein, partial [Alphaproteobacteria bacterium]